MDPFSLAITICLLGIALWAAALILRRAASRLLVGRNSVEAGALASTGEETGEEGAVLLVRAGGKVAYLSAAGRAWFGCMEEQPNLERLARRTRPAEAFLGLCAAAGTARFALSGQGVEGESYPIPYDGSSGDMSPAMLVRLRRAGREGEAVTLPGYIELSQQLSFSAVSRLEAAGSVTARSETARSETASTQTPTPGLDQETATLQAVQVGLERLTAGVAWPEDVICGVALAPPPALGTTQTMGEADVGRLALYHAPESSVAEWPWGSEPVLERMRARVAGQRSALLISDLQQQKQVSEKADHLAGSYLGVPLLAGGELVGTLEVVSYSKDAFTLKHQEALDAFAGQAALVLRLARLERVSRRMAAEQAGLARLARVADEPGGVEQVCRRLVEAILPLLEVEGLGFWLLDADSHCLRAMQPFVGFAANFSDLYSASIPPGSAGEALLRSGETILASPAADDARLKSLGLDLSARAAGFESTLCIPLTTGRKPGLGYLLVADKKDGTPFDAHDVRLYMIAAGQAAAAIQRASAPQIDPGRLPGAELDAAWVQELSRTGSEWHALISASQLEAGWGPLLGRMLEDFCRLTAADCGSLLLLGEFVPGDDTPQDTARDAARDAHSNAPTSWPEIVAQTGEAHPPELSAQETSALEPSEREGGQSSLIPAKTTRMEFGGEGAEPGLVPPHPGVLGALLVPVPWPEGMAQSQGRYPSALVILHALGPRSGNELFGPSQVQTADSLAAQAAGVLASQRALVRASARAEELAQRLARQAQRGEALRAAATTLGLNQTLEAGLEELERALRQAVRCTQVRVERPVGALSEWLPREVQRLDVDAHPVHGEPMGLGGQTSPEGGQTSPEKGGVYFLPPSATPSTGPKAAGELLLPLPDQTGVVRIQLEPAVASRSAERGPEREEWEVAQFLVGQAGRWLEAQRRQAELLRRLDRLDGAAEAVPALLRKDLEAGQAIGRLSDRLRWMQAGLELAEDVTRATEQGRAGVLRALADGLVARLGFDVVLVAEQRSPARIGDSGASSSRESTLSGSGPRLVELAGVLPEGANPQALLGQFNPLLALLNNPSGQNGRPRLLRAAELGTSRSETARSETASTLHDPNAEWADSPLLQAMSAHSFVGFAIPASGESEGVEAAVLAVRGEPFPLLAEGGFSGRSETADAAAEDSSLDGLFALLAGQAAAALGALRLRAETAHRMQEVNLLLEYSQQLGSLDPERLLETLLNSTRRLVPAAQAGCVAMAIPAAGLPPGALASLSVLAAAGYADRASALALHYPMQESGLAALAFRLGRPQRRDEVDFARDYPLAPQDLARYRDATAGKLPVSSLVAPVGDRGAGQLLGILVLENFSSPAAFSAEDEALVLSLARQTALGLEAARLYQAAEGRLAQLQALTAASARLTSRLNTGELIEMLLEGVRAVVPYDTGTLWLRSRPRPESGDRERGEERLVVRAARGFEDRENRIGLSVALAESQLLREMAPPAQFAGSSPVQFAGGRAILVPDVRQDARFPALMALAQPKYLSWLGVPLIAQGELVGAIALEKVEAAYYTPEQEQALMAFASQAATALDTARLYEESLARAAELDRRSTRLALLNRLSTELSASLDATYILQLTLQELLLAVGAAGGSALLFDAAGEVLLQAETPPSDQHPELPVVLPPEPLFDHLRQTLGVYSLDDLSRRPGETDRGPGSILPGSALQRYLAGRGARGLLVLPLVTGNDLHGLLIIHHPVPHTYTPEEVELANTISNQAAVAVQNASLFQETQWLFAETRQRSAELATLFDLGVNISQVLDQEKLIDLTFENILHLMSAGGGQFGSSGLGQDANGQPEAASAPISVSLVMPSPTERSSTETSPSEQSPSPRWNEQDQSEQEGLGELIGLALEKDSSTGGQLKRVRLILPRDGTSLHERVLASGQPLLWLEARESILSESTLSESTLSVGSAPGQSGAWLGVPLVVRGAVTGVLAVQSAEPGKFTESHLRLLAQIGNQLAVALDNARLFAAVQGYATELEQRVASRSAELTARTDQLAREHQRTQTLLGIITELSTSLDMDIVLNRTLALINETVGAMHSMIILVQPDDSSRSGPRSNLFLRATLGYSTPLPKGGMPTALRSDEGLAGWSISHRQPVLIADLWEDARWTTQEDTRWDSGDTGHTRHRSAIAVPLMMGEETLGALLLFHDEPGRFSASQLDLVQATAKQIAVAINNAQLYTLIRDQAERLGDMLRRQHIETSRSQAILEAVADGVLVTDANRVITLFNASAERILGLQREAVIGQSLEYFLGLFGPAGQAWMDTVRRWSEDPAGATAGATASIDAQVSQMGPDAKDEAIAGAIAGAVAGAVADNGAAPYTAHIELEDLRVVSVHLSPVRLRNDFLGTVSTFRDVTHQVVVDRLKSEFVATVSHELRTPMTSIKGYVEILLMGAAGQLSGQQARFLEIVRANAERLAVLVNDLLDISRIEAGRVTLSLQPLDMRQLAHEAITDLERRNAEDGKGMQIQLVLPPDGAGLPRVLGDAERVHQMLDNLLDNAYSYTPSGGHIIIRLSHTGDEVQVEVQDDGIGIHPEDQPRIFERFYRGEDPLVLATSGTGLGLSIVRHLVEMHNGRIWLKSSGIPGEGSTFTFTLPVYQP